MLAGRQAQVARKLDQPTVVGSASEALMGTLHDEGACSAPDCASNEGHMSFTTLCPAGQQPTPGSPMAVDAIPAPAGNLQPAPNADADMAPVEDLLPLTQLPGKARPSFLQSSS